MAQQVTKTTVTADTDADRSVEKTRDYSALYQTMYLIFGIITALLLIRFVFRLTGANPSAPIVDLIYTVSNIFMAPFNLIFPTNAVEGVVFEWSVLVAIAFYWLFAWIITKVITIIYTADAS